MVPAPLTGQPIFGGYVVSSQIGAGGMGEVYLVENKELRKKLVIKVLLPERSNNPELVSRFLAEARAASAIEHRNIVEILDSSKLPDGRPYILMEHLEGETLHDYAARKGRLSLDVVLAVLCQVCSGLQAAHELGIIHRDIKPSNIFISPQPDNRYFTKILDFGIAKLEDPMLAKGVMTRSVMIAGTPHYMSPEQARALRDVDHRTDLYSTGVIAYELLTGKVPYDAASVGDLVYRQARTTPRAPHEIRPGIPAVWSAVIEQAMAIEPDERPGSARVLADLMIAATPNGKQIARVSAPLLFASSDPGSGVIGVPPGDWPPARDGAPPRRRPTTNRPSGPNHTRLLPSGDRADTGHPTRPRRTEILRDSAGMVAVSPPHAGRPGRPVETLGPTDGTKVIVSPSVAAPLPVAPEGPALPPPAAPEPRAAPPGGFAPSPPLSPHAAEFMAPIPVPDTSIVTESGSSSALRWLILGVVLAASIGTALAIGLFTGPGEVPKAPAAESGSPPGTLPSATPGDEPAGVPPDGPPGPIVTPLEPDESGPVVTPLNPTNPK